MAAGHRCISARFSSRESALVMTMTAFRSGIYSARRSTRDEGRFSSDSVNLCGDKAAHVLAEGKSHRAARRVYAARARSPSEDDGNNRLSRTGGSPNHKFPNPSPRLLPLRLLGQEIRKASESKILRRDK
jgi:hypothetical protein